MNIETRITAIIVGLLGMIQSALKYFVQLVLLVIAVNVVLFVYYSNPVQLGTTIGQFIGAIERGKQ